MAGRAVFNGVVGFMLWAAVTAASATYAQAQTYPWCANFADGAGVNCGFSTLEQCQATSRGSGGSCTQNTDFRPSATATAALRHRAAKHRLHKHR